MNQKMPFLPWSHLRCIPGLCLGSLLTAPPWLRQVHWLPWELELPGGSTMRRMLGMSIVPVAPAVCAAGKLPHAWGPLDPHVPDLAG